MDNSIDPDSCLEGWCDPVHLDASALPAFLARCRAIPQGLRCARAWLSRPCGLGRLDATGVVSDFVGSTEPSEHGGDAAVASSDTSCHTSICMMEDHMHMSFRIGDSFVDSVPSTVQ